LALRAAGILVIVHEPHDPHEPHERAAARPESGSRPFVWFVVE